MPRYFIRWEIDIFDAETPQEAAEKALDIQRDPMGYATVFSVAEVSEDGKQDGNSPPRRYTQVQVDCD